MIENIKNQPVIFDQTVGICPLGTWDYGQLVDTADITEAQLKNDVCNISVNVIKNNDFTDDTIWTAGAGWTLQVVSSVASAVKAQGGSGTISQASTFVVGNRYKIEVDVDAISLVDGSVGFEVTDGVQIIGYLTGAGVSSFYFNAQGTDFTVKPTDENDTCTLSSADAWQIFTDPIIVIRDADGTFVDSLNPTDDPTVFDFVKDRLNIKIDWANDVVGLSADTCYNFGICDPCINTNGQNGFINGNFQIVDDAGDPEYWTQSNNTTTLVFLNSTPGNQSMILRGTSGASTIDFQHDLVEVGLFQYTITIEVISDGTGGFSCDVQCGDDSLNQALNVGTNTYTLTNGSAVDTDVKFQFAGPVTDLVISKVTLALTSLSNLSGDLTSNNFLYGTHDCSILLNVNNHQDALGFVWDEGQFNPRLRFGGRLNVPNDPYVIERRTHTDSLGNKFPYFFQRRKINVLAFHNEPSFIYDFVSLILGVSHWYLNDSEYVAEDDEFSFTVVNRERTLMKAEIQVSEKVQDIEAIRTEADTGGLEVGGTARITTRDENRVLVDRTQRVIKE